MENPSILSHVSLESNRFSEALAFYAQLETFAQLEEDGAPAMRPINVPPLVFQQLPAR